MKNIKLYTEVPNEKAVFQLGHDDRILMLGSCFTGNMGERMRDLRFDVLLNPFGILYNPLSMAEAMSRCLDCSGIGEEHLVFHDGLWHSWLHHGSFSRRDKAECLKACNDAIREAHNFLSNCNTVIVTFGSAWCYSLVAEDMLVANCHKVPASQFAKRLASVEEVVSVWSGLVEWLLKSGIRIVFTISPVRHQAYGAHGNQLGKAVLLMAVEALLSKYSNFSSQMLYFPAYEIVVDELRDYRFYADDLSHPSPLAEQIVWQRFQQAFMSTETISLCEQFDKENRFAAHRPFH